MASEVNKNITDFKYIFIFFWIFKVSSNWMNDVLYCDFVLKKSNFPSESHRIWTKQLEQG